MMISQKLVLHGVQRYVLLAVTPTAMSVVSTSNANCVKLATTVPPTMVCFDFLELLTF